MDVAQILFEIAPFGHLDHITFDRLVAEGTMIHFPNSDVLYVQNKSHLEGLDIILEGSYQLQTLNEGIEQVAASTLHSGDAYNSISLLANGGISKYTVQVSQGTSIFRVSTATFKELCRTNPTFYQHFLNQLGHELLDEPGNSNSNENSTEDFIGFERYFDRRIDSISFRPIISCWPQTPIYQAAEMMDHYKISCLFVEDHGKIIGYVTDITMRNSVVAAQRHSHEPIIHIIENPIHTIRGDAYVHEAILMMFRLKIRYLVIKDATEKLIGVISRNKLLTDQAQSPFLFIQSVRQANSVAELKEKWHEVPGKVYQMITRGVKPELVNQVITQVSDSIAQKVIENVLESMGPAPANFAFMALGSEGRKEQTLKTDQDNAIIYEDKANEHRSKTRKYFLAFAEKVSEDLNEIGFSFCSGGLMAKNPKWTHSLSYWKNSYDEWINAPSAESVMNFSTFFDCRMIYGDQSLIDELKAHILDKLVAPSEYFFVQLASNALHYEPPLTFFKNIRTITKGDKNVFNIKHAMTPIVDLVRVYALKHQIIRTNTGDRLKYLLDKGVFTNDDYHELMQSYYYLMSMRLKHQAKQIIYDKVSPDNFIDPANLTRIEKTTLTQIFKVIDGFQSRIKLLFMRKLY